MQEPRPRIDLSEPLNRQLKAYSLAATAAGLGVLACTPRAEAEVVYTPANIQMTRGHSVRLDLNHDGINDFNLSNFYSSIIHEQKVAVFPYNNLGNAMIKGPLGCKSNIPGPQALLPGARIGGGQAFAGTATCMALVPNHSTTGRATVVGSYGSWKGVANRYLGVQFQINSETHYGWVRISVTRAPFVITVTGYAYETIAKKAIVAGATGPVVVSAAPMTSSRLSGTLGALALGAPGLSIWRRKESLLTIE